MRYPDWDPRSWSEPYRDPPTRPEVKPVSGQWVETPQGRWVWDETAPAASSEVTQIRNQSVPPAHELGSPRREPAVTDLGEPYPTTTDETRMPEALALEPFEPEEGHHLPQQMAGLDGTQLAICPVCGSGVAADRLRKL